MLIKAWECGYCGMLLRAESEKEPPEGWLRVYWHRGGMATEVNVVVCSGRCASKAFLAADEAPRARKRPRKATQDNGSGFACPERGCGKVYALPQHLGAHRKRAHGTPSQREARGRVG